MNEIKNIRCQQLKEFIKETRGRCFFCKEKWKYPMEETKTTVVSVCYYCITKIEILRKTSPNNWPFVEVVNHQPSHLNNN